MLTHLCFVPLGCPTVAGAGLGWAGGVQPHLAMADHVPVVRALVVVLHSDVVCTGSAI